MSNTALTLVFEHSLAKGAAYCIMLALADWANKNNCAWPAVETLALKARVSMRTVQTEINELEKAGELRIDRGSGPYGVNRYFITLKAGTKTSAVSWRGEAQSATETPTRGAQSAVSQLRPNPHEPRRHEENLKTKTNTVARSQSSRAVAHSRGNERALRQHWDTGAPEFPGRSVDQPVRIDTAGSPKPRVPKHEQPPPDPLMQARAKPKSSAAAAGGGGPLFGVAEPPKAPSDEHIVREAFQAAYKAKYGLLATWGGAEAKNSKALMRAVRDAAEKRGAPPEQVLSRLCAVYLADNVKFLEDAGHPFLLLGKPAPKYLSEILKLGRGKGPVISTGSW